MNTGLISKSWAYYIPNFIAHFLPSCQRRHHKFFVLIQHIFLLQRSDKAFKTLYVSNLLPQVKVQNIHCPGNRSFSKRKIQSLYQSNYFSHKVINNLLTYLLQICQQTKYNFHQCRNYWRPSIKVLITLGVEEAFASSRLPIVPGAYFACPEDVWPATRYFYPNKGKNGAGGL